MKAVGFVVAFTLGLASAHAADLKQISPFASPAELVAARKTTTEPALEIVYRIERDGAPEIAVVDLAQDFTTITSGTHTLLYDYALRRVIDLDNTSHVMRNNSLYGELDFQVLETANRRMERGLLTSLHAGSEAKMLAPFWVQSALHIMDSEDSAPMLARNKDADGTVHFSLGGEEVASYAASTHVLPNDEARLLNRFLYAYGPLHPLIISEIVESARVPQRIAYTSWEGGKEGRGVWTLQSATSVNAVYPLKTDVKPPPLDVAALPQPGLAGIVRAPPAACSLEDYRNSVERALTGQHPFQAFLLALEMMEQYGREAANCAGAQDCHASSEIVAMAKSDSRMQILGSALQPAKQNLASAIDALGTMKRDDLSNAYLLDDFRGNLLVVARKSDEALPLLAAAIKGNPAMPGFYKDMGDAYRSQFDMASAWYFYDIGRTLPGAADAPVISTITKYETQLETLHPEFF